MISWKTLKPVHVMANYACCIPSLALTGIAAWSEAEQVQS